MGEQCPHCDSQTTYRRQYKPPGQPVNDDERHKCKDCGTTFGDNDAEERDRGRSSWHGHREKVLKQAGLWDEYADGVTTTTND